MKLGKEIRKFVEDNKNVSDDNYELSRRRFIVEGCLANSIFALTSGAFLVGYANYLGSNDQINGIIVAIPLLANIIQMFSPLLIERLASRKKLVTVMAVSFRVLLASMILIPFITDIRPVRLFILGAIYLLAYSAASFLTPAAASWIVSLVPERGRGKYFGFRDMCILGFTAAVTLIMGRVLDAFKSASMDLTGFIVVFSVVAVMIVFNGLMLNSIKEPEVVLLKKKLNLKSMLMMSASNKEFRKVVLLSILWNIAGQLSIPFFAVYMVTGLKLSYTFIMVMSIVISITQAFAARKWGRFSDRFGWERSVVISLCFVGSAHVIWMLVNTHTYMFLLPIIQFIAGIGWAGINLSMFNIQFKYAPQEGRTVFVGFNAALAGIAGFTSASVGAVLVGLLSGVKINIGITVLDNMLLIFGASGTLIILCGLLTYRIFGLGKEKIRR